MPSLTNPQRVELRAIIADAFVRKELKMALQDRLGLNLELYVSDDNYEIQLSELFGKLNREGKEFAVLNALTAARPDNEKLQRFAHRAGLLGAATDVAATRELEALVTRSPFFDATKLLMRLTELFRQVCRIELDDRPLGTGFIVGPDLVMTNFHVAKHFINQPDKIAKVTARFDYRRAPDGVEVYKGNAYALAAQDPVVAFSPYDALDEQDLPIEHPMPIDKLDYALLRLAARAGEEPAGPRKDGNVPQEENTRGWIKYPKPTPVLGAVDPLFIVQHPQGRPLEIAFDATSTNAYDPNGVRVRYQTNTEAGASGSPCFDRDWKWVALHNSGVTGSYNQGIPSDKVIADLERQGLLDLLTAE